MFSPHRRCLGLLITLWMAALPASAGPLLSASLTLVMEGYAPLVIDAGSSAASGSFQGGSSGPPGSTLFGDFTFNAGDAFAGTYTLVPSGPTVPNFLGFDLVPEIQLDSGSPHSGSSPICCVDLGGAISGSFGWRIPDWPVPAFPPIDPSLGSSALPLGSPTTSTRTVTPTGPGVPFSFYHVEQTGDVWYNDVSFFPGLPVGLQAGGSPLGDGTIAINRVTAITTLTDLQSAVGILDVNDSRTLFSQLSLVFAPEPNLGLLLAVFGVGLAIRSRRRTA